MFFLKPLQMESDFCCISFPGRHFTSHTWNTLTSWGFVAVPRRGARPHWIVPLMQAKLICIRWKEQAAKSKKHYVIHAIYIHTLHYITLQCITLHCAAAATTTTTIHIFWFIFVYCSFGTTYMLYHMFLGARNAEQIQYTVRTKMAKD